MKSILISIRGEWTEKILAGWKDIEIRREFLREPVQCFIYETKAKYLSMEKDGSTRFVGGKGAVIGEFICNGAKEYSRPTPEVEKEELLQRSCLSEDALRDYLDRGKPVKKFYGIEVDALQSYEKPLPLTEFIRPKTGEIIVTAPQNWCYAERRNHE